MSKSQRNKYTAEQIAHWNQLNNQQRAGGIVCGDARIRKVTPEGVCFLPLDQWTP
jgi:hypothetical protein